MTLVLAWRTPAPPLAIAWRGSGLSVAAMMQEGRIDDIAAVIGPPGPQQLYVQDAQPDMVAGQPWTWWKTIGGEISELIIFDGVI